MPPDHLWWHHSAIYEPPPLQFSSWSVKDIKSPSPTAILKCSNQSPLHYNRPSCSLLWTKLIWRVIEDFTLKGLPQNRQENGCSPLCARIWTFKLPLRVKHFEHSWHLNGFPPVFLTADITEGLCQAINWKIIQSKLGEPLSQKAESTFGHWSHSWPCIIS